jgi:hypothetical protein
MLNFNRWVNRKDRLGKNVFEGGIRDGRDALRRILGACPWNDPPRPSTTGFGVRYRLAFEQHTPGDASSIVAKCARSGD